ncbi:MAG: thiosulfate oxidation carrier protein SoxY [Burkholderiales bacterium]|nr:thiosulfate oxidation carrier protein SoxY [Burkholderiales bacterium]
MNHSRRKAIQSGGGLIAMLLAAGVISPGEALAQSDPFTMKTLAEAMRAVGGPNQTVSDAIIIKAPAIAENGAVVPVGVESKLPGTELIALFVEKNPQPLVGSFGIPSGTVGNVSTRVKMGQTSDVYALVKADGRFYVAKKEIKITLGGCGG